MGEIVPFKRKPKTDEIDAYLREAVQLTKKTSKRKEGDLAFDRKFQEAVQIGMCNILLAQKLISSEIFICVAHAASVIQQGIASVPESFYAADYLVRGNDENEPKYFLEGADLCLIICVFFPERELRRTMRKGDYHWLGAMLYSNYYARTKKPFGWHMSQHFKTVAQVAAEACKKL